MLPGMNSNIIERDRVHSIVSAFYTVYNYYDFGLVEPIYAAALEIELRGQGHEVAREVAVAVAYRGQHVAWQRLDMLVDRRVVVEIKSTEHLSKYAPRQIMSYLRATPHQVGLILHFGPEPKFHRFVDSRPRAYSGNK